VSNLQNRKNGAAVDRTPKLTIDRTAVAIFFASVLHFTKNIVDKIFGPVLYCWPYMEFLSGESDASGLGYGYMQSEHSTSELQPLFEQKTNWNAIPSNNATGMQ
jgi:hypothetical protein